MKALCSLLFISSFFLPHYIFACDAKIKANLNQDQVKSQTTIEGAAKGYQVFVQVMRELARIGEICSDFNIDLTETSSGDRARVVGNTLKVHPEWLAEMANLDPNSDLGKMYAQGALGLAIYFDTVPQTPGGKWEQAMGEVASARLKWVIRPTLGDKQHKGANFTRLKTFNLKVAQAMGQRDPIYLLGFAFYRLTTFSGIIRNQGVEELQYKQSTHATVWEIAGILAIENGLPEMAETLIATAKDMEYPQLIENQLDLIEISTKGTIYHELLKP